MKCLRSFLLLWSLSVSAADEDRLAPWRQGVNIAAVAPGDGRHTIHSYFNTCPESPDGQWVLFFASKALNGHTGDICMRHRETGKERVLVAGLNVEDAHRAACQQWVSNGKHVVYHGEREGRWFVGCVDVETGADRVLVRDQLVCWGQPHGDIVPIYGMHWNPGDRRDLQLLNAATGDITTAVTLKELKAAYPDWWEKSFGEKLPSIFFPILSPDLSRVFFKMAVPGNGDPRSGAASSRQGLICYSLAEKRFLYMNQRWGHPSWMPDSRHIAEAGNLVYDSNDGAYKRLPDLPPCRGDHPSVSLDGKLRVTDSTMDKFGGKESEWGIVLADARGGSHLLLHQFVNNEGARSWRKSHPHPVFSADAKRIYFNVSAGTWTRLYVAEVSDGLPDTAGPAR
jgi:Tol biopolymer transport system component